jgi:hypothetical protein
MTTLALKSKTAHHKSKMASFSGLRINWKMVYAVGMAALLLMLAFYVFEINELTKGTYLIKSYNKQISQLSMQNKVLKANSASSDFLAGVQAKVRDMGFQKTADIQYVQVVETQLASAR